MSNKMWDSLVEHAKTCVLSGKLYVYYPDDSRNVGVVFNNIYEFSGLIASGQYHSAESLPDTQKVSFASLFAVPHQQMPIFALFRRWTRLNYFLFKKTHGVVSSDPLI